MKNLFSAHPRSIGETYLEHFKYAFITSMQLIGSGLALLIHAIFPFLFTQTASQTIFSLNEEILARKKKNTSL